MCFEGGKYGVFEMAGIKTGAVVGVHDVAHLLAPPLARHLANRRGCLQLTSEQQAQSRWSIIFFPLGVEQ